MFSIPEHNKLSRKFYKSIRFIFVGKIQNQKVIMKYFECVFKIVLEGMVGFLGLFLDTLGLLDIQFLDLVEILGL